MPTRTVERWFCETTDARSDPEITEAIVRFIDHHGAKSVAAVDRIIGFARMRKALTTRRRKMYAVSVLSTP